MHYPFAGVWFKFAPKSEGQVTIKSLQSRNEETYFSVHDESCLKPIINTENNEKVLSFYALKNEEYRIFATGEFVISSSSYTYCSAPILIDSFPYDFSGKTSGYPYMVSECTGKTAQGMWFKIVGNGGKVFISLIEASHVPRQGTLLEVYEQCNGTRPGSCIKSVERFDDLGSMIVLDAKIESAYYIFAGSTAKNISGIEFRLTAILYDSFDNSQCRNGTIVPKLPCGFSGTTIDKSYSSITCEVGVFCPRKGAWFHYVHDEEEERMISVSTCNHRLNKLKAVIEVYPSCDLNYCVAIGSYETSVGCSRVAFNAVHGREYNIYVTADEYSDPGDYYYVDFAYVGAQPHENCSAFEFISSFPTAIVGHTKESAPSWDECSGENRSGYWVGVVGNGKTYHVTTNGDQTDFETSLSLYSSCPNVSSTSPCIAHSESKETIYANLSWKTENGQSYFIFVSGRKGYTGIFSLKVYDSGVPENSMCIAPSLIHEFPSTKYASLAYANYSDSGCYRGKPRRGLWYLVPGQNRYVYVSTCDSMTDFKTKIEVYLGCSDRRDGGVVCVTPHREESYSCGFRDVISFRANKGTYYWIYVTTAENAKIEAGFYALTVTMGDYFFELSKPVFIYVIDGLGALFIFFSCIGFITAVITLICACVRKNNDGYLEIVR